MKTNKTAQGIWQEYEKAMQYNSNLDLYETVKRNENFFIGNQWEGVKAPDLEKPVLNFIKRVTTYLIAMIVSDDVAASLTPFHRSEQNNKTCKVLERELKRVIENTKAKTKGRDMLRSAVVDGDGCFYLYYDNDLPSGQKVKGDIAVENIENTKVLFGNPHVNDVQKQPYILLVRREQLGTVREQAAAYGLKETELIRPDSDERYYGEEKDDQGELVTVIVKLWKENGTVHVLECTKDVIVRKEFSPGYRLYPLAYMSWEKIKNSYHGQSAITGLIPNQIFVNKLWAMAMEHQKKMAFPKLFYDMTKIPHWSNKVGQAIGVAGSPKEAVAQNFRAADMSGQVLELVEKTISYTREFMGASDAALGNVRPDNTSAIIAVQKASAAPLELQRMAFYQFVEDYINIMLDMMRCHFGVRIVDIVDAETGETVQEKFDFSKVDMDGLQLQVDVGSSTYWSELMQVQTLDNLFAKGIITDAVTYLENVPDEYVRNKNQLIAKLREQQNSLPDLTGLEGGQPGVMPDLGALAGLMPQTEIARAGLGQLPDYEIGGELDGTMSTVQNRIIPQ